MDMETKIYKNNLLEDEYFKVIKTLYMLSLVYYIIYDKQKDSYLMVCFGHNIFNLKTLRDYLYNDLINIDIDVIEDNAQLTEYDKDKAIIFNSRYYDHAYGILNVIEFQNLEDVPSIAMDIDDSLISMEFSDKNNNYAVLIKGPMKESVNRTSIELNLTASALSSLDIIQHGITIGPLSMLNPSYDKLSRSVEFANFLEFITYDTDNKTINSYKFNGPTVDIITSNNWIKSSFSTSIINYKFILDSDLSETPIDTYKDIKVKESPQTGEDLDLLAASKWNIDGKIR